MAKFGHIPEIGANVYISTTEKGRAEIVWYTYRGAGPVLGPRSAACLAAWQYLKGLSPARLISKTQEPR
jgi:hypothetical protein